MLEASTLSTKQQRFIDEYLVDCNGARAAVAAGYGLAGSRVAAHRLLTRANVRASIAALQVVDARRLEIGRQDVIDGLLEAVSLAKEQQDPAAMIRGWSELAKLMGFYAPQRHQVAVETREQRAALGRFEDMTDAELLAVMTDGANTWG